MPYCKEDFPYIDDFCDDEIYVFSTLGKGPKGDKGDKGDQGDKGDDGDVPTELIRQMIYDWLDEHPEATTTVQDDSITSEKLAPDLRENYVEAFDALLPKSDFSEELTVKKNTLTSITVLFL